MNLIFWICQSAWTTICTSTRVFTHYFIGFNLPTAEWAFSEDPGKIYSENVQHPLFHRLTPMNGCNGATRLSAGISVPRGSMEDIKTCCGKAGLITGILQHIQYYIRVIRNRVKKSDSSHIYVWLCLFFSLRFYKTTSLCKQNGKFYWMTGLWKSRVHSGAIIPSPSVTKMSNAEKFKSDQFTMDIEEDFVWKCGWWWMNGGEIAAEVISNPIGLIPP